MTDLQKLKIQNLRQENYSFAKIAETLQMKESTIKSYCQRHGVKTPDIPRKTKAEKAELSICRYCGKKLENPWNRIGKVFCSDNCRTAFHNEEKRLTACLWSLSELKIIGGPGGGKLCKSHRLNPERSTALH